MFGILVALIVVLGQNTFFINLSTMHTFYAQRLTRAYLGATNAERLCNSKSHMTDVIGGDDIPADRYWRWPQSPHVGMVESLVAQVADAGRWVLALPVKAVKWIVSLFTEAPMTKKEAPAAAAPLPAATTARRCTSST